MECVDRYGRELKAGDIVMKYGEFLMFSHATEKRLMCKRPGGFFCALQIRPGYKLQPGKVCA